MNSIKEAEDCIKEAEDLYFKMENSFGLARLQELKDTLESKKKSC